MALTLSKLLAVGLRNILALFLLHRLTLPLIDIKALLLGNTAALLLGLLAALLSGHVAALLGVVNLLTHLPGHLLADLSIHSLTLLVVGGRTLLGRDVLKIARCKQVLTKAIILN